MLFKILYIKVTDKELWSDKRSDDYRTCKVRDLCLFKMMNSHLLKLNNKLNRKRIDYIEIQGTCYKNGRIQQQFTDVMRYDDEYNYYVTCTSAQFSSLFPNIIKDKNDKFYYFENDVLKL